MHTASNIAQGLADFLFGALPALAALAGISALFLGPLWILARALGVC